MSRPRPSKSLATSRGHSQIEPAHLLRALLGQPEGSTIPVLQKLGVSVDALQSQVERLLEQTPKVTGGAQPQLGHATSRVLDSAFQEADAMEVSASASTRTSFWRRPRSRIWANNVRAAL